MATKVKKVFISHAHKDAELAQRLVNLLKLGMHIHHDHIFCTSADGQGLMAGDSLPDEVKSELKRAGIVIALMSRSYFDSSFCMCEMGAIWMTNIPVALVLVPPVIRTDLPDAVQGRIVTKLEDKQLDNLQKTICQRLSVSNPSSDVWNPNKNEFLAFTATYKSPKGRVSRDDPAELTAALHEIEEKKEAAKGTGPDGSAAAKPRSASVPPSTKLPTPTISKTPVTPKAKQPPSALPAPLPSPHPMPKVFEKAVEEVNDAFSACRSKALVRAVFNAYKGQGAWYPEDHQMEDAADLVDEDLLTKSDGVGNNAFYLNMSDPRIIKIWDALRAFYRCLGEPGVSTWWDAEHDFPLNINNIKLWNMYFLNF